MPGILIIKPKCAKLTYDTEMFGKMDPFAVIHVGNQKFTTAIAKDAGKNPSWIDTFNCKIGNESILQISVSDYDSCTNNDFIGEGSYALQGILMGGKKTEWVQINRHGKSSGQVLLDLEFKPDGHGQGYPPQQGYAPQQGYPPQQGFVPQQHGYPPQQPGYPPQQPGFPPQQPGFPPQQPGFPAQQPGFPAQQPGFPPQQPGFPPQQHGFNPQPGFPPQQQGFPPQQGGYPPPPNFYPPQQGGYPPPPNMHPPQQGGYPNVPAFGQPQGLQYQGKTLPRINFIHGCKKCGGTGFQHKHHLPCGKCYEHAGYCKKCCGTGWNFKKNEHCHKCGKKHHH